MVNGISSAEELQPDVNFYFCGWCDRRYEWSADDEQAAREQPHMPCGCEWIALESDLGWLDVPERNFEAEAQEATYVSDCDQRWYQCDPDDGPEFVPDENVPTTYIL